MHIPTADYRYSLMEHHHYRVRSNNPSPIEHGVPRNKGRDICNNHQPHVSQFAYSSASLHDNYHPEVVPMGNFVDRFSSLERSSHYSESSDTDNRTSATLPRNSTIPHSTASVLLPNQTYPETSLMRTQSLGNMDNLKHHSERKNKEKEKEWYESSLDSSPNTAPKPESPFNMKPLENHTPPATSPTESIGDNPNVIKTNQASINNIQFDTVVPYESPKNHTVVQAGKWQPYREVTKPFEMSDFYKYSTKYRQQSKMQNAHGQPPLADTSGQHKGVYKAPMPLECQPVSPSENANPIHHPINAAQRYEEQQNVESATWYRNKNIPKPRSSTLV